MHYCTYIFTEKIPTNEDIDRVMAPFYEGDFYRKLDEGSDSERPAFLWDWCVLGGRYCGNIKLRIDEDNEEYKWHIYMPGGREGKIFRSSIFKTLSSGEKIFFSEEDYYPYMGYHDGYLYVDGAYAKDIMNIDDLQCYQFIDENGMGFARESWNDAAEKFEKDELFDVEFKATIERAKENNLFITVIDCHD